MKNQTEEDLSLVKAARSILWIGLFTFMFFIILSYFLEN
jgi:hypothetical protein